MNTKEAITILKKGAWWEHMPSDVSKDDIDPFYEALEMAVSSLRAQQWQEKHRSLILEELTQAEEEGRLIILPCKIGDTVYVIPSKTNYALNILSGHPENNRIYEQPVKEVSFYSGGVFLMITCDGTQAVHSNFFGETWFLTLEEAEYALEALKGGEGND